MMFIIGLVSLVFIFYLCQVVYAILELLEGGFSFKSEFYEMLSPVYFIKIIRGKLRDLK